MGVWGRLTKIGETMDEPKRVERAEKESRIWPRPYIHLSVGFGFLAATVMVVATSGVFAAGICFVIPAAIFFGLSVNEFQQQRLALPKPASRERELLSAIRDNGDSITAAEAAMETSLTVREADGMLSELAAGGHLMVKGKNGTLFYSLAGRGDPEFEGRLER
jgi:hypothetical protein